mgnify:CR=1 FL=1
MILIGFLLFSVALNIWLIRNRYLMLAGMDQFITMLEDREQDAYRKFASDLDAAKLDVEYFFAGMVEQCRRYGNFKDKDFDYVREFSDALMADKHFGSRTREHVIKLVFYRRRGEAYDLASLAPTPVDREDMADQAARLQV